MRSIYESFKVIPLYTGRTWFAARYYKLILLADQIGVDILTAIRWLLIIYVAFDLVLESSGWIPHMAASAKAHAAWLEHRGPGVSSTDFGDLAET